MRSSRATVRSFRTSPVSSVEAGSNSRTCASAPAMGRTSGVPGRCFSTRRAVAVAGLWGSARPETRWQVVSRSMPRGLSGDGGLRGLGPHSPSLCECVEGRSRGGRTTRSRRPAAGRRSPGCWPPGCRGPSRTARPSRPAPPSATVRPRRHCLPDGADRGGLGDASDEPVPLVVAAEELALGPAVPHHQKQGAVGGPHVGDGEFGPGPGRRTISKNSPRR